MKSDTLVSIIVPAYNVEKYIEPCIDSIIKQTYKNLEIIVINDGSCDSTYDILKSFSDDRIVLINQDNSGVSASRNKGLMLAKGKYVVFVDSDDYLCDDFVAFFVDAAEKNDSDFVFSIYYQNRMGNNDNGSYAKIITNESATEWLLNPRVMVGCWNKIFNREFLLRNKIYFSTDLFYGEGLRFITSASQLANNIVALDCRKYFYRRENLNSATNSFNINKYLNGEKSLVLIKDTLIIHSKKLNSMLLYHTCLFYLGGVCAIISSKTKQKHRQLYKKWIAFLRKNTLKVLFFRNVSFSRRLVLLAGTFFPSIVSSFNEKRKKRIRKTGL